MTSAWQNPAVNPGKADWELSLVESASNHSIQKPTMGGGLDPLLLNGMYDQGAVRQHVNAQTSVGSSSSVALHVLSRSTTLVLGLPAPDGTVQAIGQDPFGASLNILAPSYVQMSEIEKKQQLLFICADVRNREEAATPDPGTTVMATICLEWNAWSALHGQH